MCRAMEQMREEAYKKAYEEAYEKVYLDAKKGSVIKMLKSGEFSLEKTAELNEVPLEWVQEIALSIQEA